MVVKYFITLVEYQRPQVRCESAHHYQVSFLTKQPLRERDRLMDRVTRRTRTSGREAKAQRERPAFSSPNLAVLMLASIVL
jgi:hypothetical protein